MFYKAVGYQEHFTDILGVSPEPRSTVTEARQAGAQGEPWQVAGADPLYRAKFNFVQNQLRNLDIVLTPGQGDIVHVDAAEARFRGRGEWLLNGVVVDGQRRFSQAVWRTSVRPKDLSLGQVTLSMRPLNEIIRFVRAHPHTPQYRLDLYSRLAYPLTGIILLMLGLPLVLGSERLLRSHLLGTGAAVIVGLLFFGVQFVAYHLGDTGQLPPSAAVLTPVVLGFAAGGFLMDTMRS
jgi:lipopolysaccharide export LptBFGC system permease protein LptF